jgi:hypothetical protein
VAEFTDRKLHLVKKALAIATLAIARQPGPFQSGADQTDMKALLDELIESDTELEHSARAARERRHRRAGLTNVGKIVDP